MVSSYGWAGDLGEGLGLRSIIMLSVGVGVLVFCLSACGWSCGGLGWVCLASVLWCVTLVALGGVGWWRGLGGVEVSG